MVRIVAVSTQSLAGSARHHEYNAANASSPAGEVTECGVLTFPSVNHS
ncbi:unannotated protein [freshwater metagenome]|uniref:Unannotated protein n=1 Tax=freshwater metagenome TaxID=449393 RepID=A0A6J6IB68_9ZZZZ